MIAFGVLSSTPSGRSAAMAGKETSECANGTNKPGDAEQQPKRDEQRSEISSRLHAQVYVDDPCSCVNHETYP